MALCLVGLFACNGDDPTSETGLLVKKFKNDDTWTVCGYSGTDTEIDIAAMAKDEEGNPVTVGRIMKGAFDYNDTIVSVIVPDTVETIDEGAFRNMGKLRDLVLPFVGHTAIADGSFNQTEPQEDKSVGVERTFSYIFGTEEYDGGLLFTQVYQAGDDGTKDYYIPRTLKNVTISPAEDYTIPMYAFAGSSSNWTLINKIVLGSKVVAIGDYAFSGCVGLNVLDTNNVTDIGDYAFSGCTNLKENGLTLIKVVTIGDYAFEKVAIGDLVLPDTVTEVGKYAFTGSKVVTVELSSALNVLSEGIFSDCKNLKSVVVKNASIEIKAYAFESCTAINTFGPSGTAEKTAVFTGYNVQNQAFARVDKSNFDSITGLSDVDAVFFSVE